MNKCQNCGKEMIPDSSYYASDGDKTFWYTDQFDSILVCEECYCDLMAEIIQICNELMYLRKKD